MDVYQRLVQATGVEITEVRDNSRENGAVRRLAVNRWISKTTFAELFTRSSLPGAEESNEGGRDGELFCISLLSNSYFKQLSFQRVLGEMLVKLMTSESEKSHGSMMLR